MGVVEPGHLLVADLGVEADQLGMLELVDERQRVPGGGQQDVPAWLVRLRLEREADAVALVENVGAEDVVRLLAPVQRGPHILGRAGLRAVTAAPAHVDPGPELGREVEVAHHLGQGEAAHVPVVRGEPALLEDRVREQVRGRRRHHQAGLVERLAERRDPVGALLVGVVEPEHVVVVEVHAVGADLGQLAHGALGRHRRADRAAEDIHALPADGPDPERELVRGRRCEAVCSQEPVLSSQVAVSSRSAAWRSRIAGCGGPV